MLGGGVTVNKTPLLAVLLTVTTALPVVAPVGTLAVMLVELKLLMVAWMPLKVTCALAALVPKLLPAITMAEPTAPVLGVRLLMTGAAATAKKGHKSCKKITVAVRRNCLIKAPRRLSVDPCRHLSSI